MIAARCSKIICSPRAECRVEAWARPHLVPATRHVGRRRRRPPAPTTSSGPTRILRNRVKQFLAEDFLSPLGASALFPDVLQRFIPYPAIGAFDRARAFEASLEETWPTELSRQSASGKFSEFVDRVGTGADARSQRDHGRGRQAGRRRSGGVRRQRIPFDLRTAYQGRAGVGR